MQTGKVCYRLIATRTIKTMMTIIILMIIVKAPVKRVIGSRFVKNPSSS